jgi:ATP-dependent helicase HrpB
MVGGVGARLDDASVVRDGELLVALDAAPIQGVSGRFVLVRSASLVRREWLAEVTPDSIREEAEVRFDEASGRVVGLRRRFYLDLPLDERETGSVDPERAARLLHEVACAAPARAIPLEPELEQWFLRLRWLLSVRPDLAGALAAGEVGDRAIGDAGAGRGGDGSGESVRPSPPHDPVVDAAGDLLPWFLAALGAYCVGKRSLQDLRDGTLVASLDAALPGSLAAALAQFAPKTVNLPSGRSARLEYRAAEAPVLAARLQEFFGGGATPRVGGGRVPVLLHLLAPNHRPVQVTSDLASFWTNIYPKIRVELRRRYPRHSWPDDPATAPPERGPKRREPRKG